MTFKNKVTTLVLAGALALTSAGVATAQRNSSETHPSPTSEVTRSERGATKERRAKVRGEGEWMFINYSNFEILSAFRMDMGSERFAEVMVDEFSDPDMIEDNLEAEYEGTFRVPRDLGYCEGVELYNTDNDVMLYSVACADGEYINFAVGTDKEDTIDAITDMQDGFVPAPDGYVLEDD